MLLRHNSSARVNSGQRSSSQESLANNALASKGELAVTDFQISKIRISNQSAKSLLQEIPISPGKDLLNLTKRTSRESIVSKKMNKDINLIIQTGVGTPTNLNSTSPIQEPFSLTYRMREEYQKLLHQSHMNESKVSLLVKYGSTPDQVPFKANKTAVKIQSMPIECFDAPKVRSIRASGFAMQPKSPE